MVNRSENLFKRKKILDMCSDLAVCMFNDGMSSVMVVMEVLGITIGNNLFHFCVEADATRIQHSERSLTEKAKKARLALKSARKLEEDNVNVEGQLYCPRIAN